MAVRVCVSEGGVPGGGGTAGKVAGRGRPQLTKFLAKAIRSARALLCYYQKKNSQGCMPHLRSHFKLQDLLGIFCFIFFLRDSVPFCRILFRG